MNEWWESVFLAAITGTAHGTDDPAKIVDRAMQIANSAMLRQAADVDGGFVPATASDPPTCLDGFRNHSWNSVGICARCGFRSAKLAARARHYRKKLKEAS